MKNYGVAAAGAQTSGRSGVTDGGAVLQDGNTACRCGQLKVASVRFGAA